MTIAELSDPIANGQAHYLGIDFDSLPVMLIFKHHHYEVDKHFLKG